MKPPQELFSLNRRASNGRFLSVSVILPLALLIVAAAQQPSSSVQGGSPSGSFEHPTRNIQLTLNPISPSGEPSLGKATAQNAKGELQDVRGKSHADAQVDSKPAMAGRPFYLAMMAVPVQPLNTENWLKTYDFLKHNAEYILHHHKVGWDALKETSEPKKGRYGDDLNFVEGMSKRHGLKLFVVLDPRNGGPPYVGSKNYGQSEVRSAFQNTAIYLARRLKPRFMALGSEVNTYLSKHPEDVDNFLSLYRETYDAVKQHSPDTMITVTLQYEELTGKTKGVAQWGLLSEFLSKLDAVAISTYPSPFFKDPEKIPDNYYTQLWGRTQKPVIIAESGWPSGGKSQFGGSLEKQSRFITRLDKLTADLDKRLWVWWFPHDWDGDGYPEFFKTMGLRTSDGKPKPALAAWQAIASRPVSGAAR